MKTLNMISTILSMKDGKHETHEGVRKIITNNLSIKSEESIDSNLDGEKYTNNNFDIEVIPNGITIFNNQDLLNSFEEVKKKKLIKISKK